MCNKFFSSSLYIIIVKNYEEMSKRAGQIIIDGVKKNPEIVLGLATGSTPIGLYKEMIEAYKSGLDYSRVKTFNLDEYVGLSPDHVSSYSYFMHTELFDHINIDEKNISIPNGKALDLDGHCKDYDRAIEEAGGIDIQVLGVGENGHIAFNEPSDFLHANTCITELTEDTIVVNSRFFDNIEEVPNTAISMGIGSILKAKKIILLANGPKKTPVITRLLESKNVTTDFPVSFLLVHPDVTIIVDEEAANRR